MASKEKNFIGSGGKCCNYSLVQYPCQSLLCAELDKENNIIEREITDDTDFRTDKFNEFALLPRKDLDNYGNQKGNVSPCVLDIKIDGLYSYGISSSKCNKCENINGTYRAYKMDYGVYSDIKETQWPFYDASKKCTNYPNLQLNLETNNLGSFWYGHLCSTDKEKTSRCGHFGVFAGLYIDPVINEDYSYNINILCGLTCICNNGLHVGSINHDGFSSLRKKNVGKFILPNEEKYKFRENVIDITDDINNSSLFFNRSTFKGDILAFCSFSNFNCLSIDNLEVFDIFTNQDFLNYYKSLGFFGPGNFDSLTTFICSTLNFNLFSFLTLYPVEGENINDNYNFLRELSSAYKCNDNNIKYTISIPSNNVEEYFKNFAMASKFQRTLEDTYIYNSSIVNNNSLPSYCDTFKNIHNNSYRESIFFVNNFIFNEIFIDNFSDFINNHNTIYFDRFFSPISGRYFQISSSPYWFNENFSTAYYSYPSERDFIYFDYNIVNNNCYEIEKNRNVCLLFQLNTISVEIENVKNKNCDFCEDINGKHLLTHRSTLTSSSLKNDCLGLVSYNSGNTGIFQSNTYVKIFSDVENEKILNDYNTNQLISCCNYCDKDYINRIQIDFNYSYDKYSIYDYNKLKNFLDFKINSLGYPNPSSNLLYFRYDLYYDNNLFNESFNQDLNLILEPGLNISVNDEKENCDFNDIKVTVKNTDLNDYEKISFPCIPESNACGFCFNDNVNNSFLLNIPNNWSHIFYRKASRPREIWEEAQCTQKLITPCCDLNMPYGEIVLNRTKISNLNDNCFDYFENKYDNIFMDNVKTIGTNNSNREKIKFRILDDNFKWMNSCSWVYVNNNNINNYGYNDIINFNRINGIVTQNEPYSTGVCGYDYIRLYPGFFNKKESPFHAENTFFGFILRIIKILPSFLYKSFTSSRDGDITYFLYEWEDYNVNNMYISYNFANGVNLTDLNINSIKDSVIYREPFYFKIFHGQIVDIWFDCENLQDFELDFLHPLYNAFDTPPYGYGGIFTHDSYYSTWGKSRVRENFPSIYDTDNNYLSDYLEMEYEYDYYPQYGGVCPSGTKRFITEGCTNYSDLGKNDDLKITISSL